MDEAGRARREILHISMPGMGLEPDAQIRLVVDFSRFGEHVPPIVAPVAGPDGVLTLPAVVAPPRTTQTVFDFVLPHNLVQWAAIGLMLALFVVLVNRRRRLRLYVAVVTTTIVAMVGAPLANVGVLEQFRTRLAQASTLDQARADIGLTPKTGDGLERFTAQVAQLQQPVQGTPAADLRDCRVLYVDQGIDPAGDDDQDGLHHADEWCLGTDFKKPDTDNDTITDTLEVQGFTDA